MKNDDHEARFHLAGIDVQAAAERMDVNRLLVTLERPITAELGRVAETGVPCVSWSVQSQKVHHGEWSHCIPSLLKLEDAGDVDILNFVKRFGPIGGQAGKELWWNAQGKMWAESTARYRELSARVNGLLSCCVELREGKCAREQDFAKVYEVLVREKVLPKEHEVRMQRELIAMEVTRFFQWAYALPVVQWPANTDAFIGIGAMQDAVTWDGLCFSPHLETLNKINRDLLYAHAKQIAERGESEKTYVPMEVIGPRPSPLRAYIASYLASVITSRSNYYRCDVCALPFESRNRKLRPDYNRLCSDDCRRENARLNNNKSYKKLPEQKRSKRRTIKSSTE